MQDYTFLDDYDYTECTQCHSHIQPYDNTSITTIMTQTTTTTTTTTIEINRDTLKSTNSFTRTLLKYHHLHCEKCGLYIEIHPKYDDEVAQKIFICSNTNNDIPHKYCLCYHCGLLYGINPNAKSIDIISILQTQIDNMQKEKELSSENQIQLQKQNKVEQDENDQHHDNHHHHDHGEDGEEEHSLESREVNDDNDDCSEDDSVNNQDRKDKEISRNNKIDESYMNILALKEKLSNIQHSNTANKTVSCPSSPNTVSSKFSLSNLPQSLRGSPLLGPSTPSPRVLGRDVDEMETKWHNFKKERLVNKSNVKDKLQEQQSQIDNLQQLLKQIQDRKKQAMQGAKLFAGKPYSRGLKKNDT